MKVIERQKKGIQRNRENVIEKKGKEKAGRNVKKYKEGGTKNADETERKKQKEE